MIQKEGASSLAVRKELTNHEAPFIKVCSLDSLEVGVCMMVDTA